MTTIHLSETQLQQYVLDKTACDNAAIRHLETCASCRMQAETYQSLFTGIQQQPPAVFGFDLAALVLQQLPESAQESGFAQTVPDGEAGARSIADRWLVPLLSLVAFVAIGVSLYLYRDYFIKISSDILPMTLFLLLLPVIAVLLFQGIELYRKYQRQIDAI